MSMSNEAERKGTLSICLVVSDSAARRATMTFSSEDVAAIAGALGISPNDVKDVRVYATFPAKD
jgi:hypothetical protein